MALHPDVLRELEEASAARRIKTENVSAQGRINALEARIACLEAAPCGNSAPHLDEDFWTEVTAVFREFVDGHVSKLKAENAALAARVKCLEDRPPLKYCGVWAAKTYPENSLVTRDGSLWIAKRTTAAYPGGGAEPDSWQLCVKRGQDGKDGKDASPASR